MPRSFFRFSRACRRRGPAISQAYAVSCEHASSSSDGVSRSTHDSQRGTARRTASSTRDPRPDQSADRGGRIGRSRIASADLRPSRCNRRVRQPHDARPQERRGAQIRRGIGQIAQQRHRVLDFVGVEEAQPLVDVGRHAAPLERLLELAVAVARAEQDRDVGRPRGARDAGRPIAHGRAVRAAGRFRRRRARPVA